MRGLTSKAVLSLLVCSTVAFQLVERENPAVLLAPIQRRQDATTRTSPVARDRLRRELRRSKAKRDPLTVSLDNSLSLYFANVTIGTPPQSLGLHLDTGSSDIWANSADSQFCQQDRRNCAQSGTYSANDSSTYTYVNSDFNISYVDGSGAMGDYATDVLSIGGISIENMQIGIGYESSSYQGILGIGYASNTASDARENMYYPNLPVQLVSSGVIEANVYSLWLNDLEASTGSVLFGGVDTDKYNGSLQTVPIIQEDGEYQQFVIALTDVGTNGQVGSIASAQAIPAVLDSGSSLTYLPDAFAQAIFDTFGAEYDEQQGAAQVDCDLANSNENILFTFSGVSITVGMDEMVLIDDYDQYGPLCIMGVIPSGGINPVLGDTFLRSAYIVYDLDGNTISLAQTRFNSTSDNIVQVTNSTGIPGATPVASPVTAVVGLQTGQVVDNSGQPSVRVETSSGAAMRTAAPIPFGAGASVMAAAAGFGALLAL